ncbi:putative acetyltransferase, GNAT family [Whalleya microplaca]|nr:putative acetyltransferase, GNAT family [Whalleya microplaca]
MASSTPNPIGPAVTGNPAHRPSRDTQLAGRHITLVGLSTEHADGLYPHIARRENAHLWDYMSDGPYSELSDFRANIAAKAASTDPVFYAILSSTSGSVIGFASLMRIETAHRCVEVGNIMYTAALQRTAAATEAMYLLARHAFEDLGFRRYEWKCNALNAPSRRAALRLGFVFEGVFRKHMLVKGRNRDTAWYSMIDDEWPDAKKAMEAWLDPGNFDEEGRQRRRLEEFRQ